MRAAAIVLRNHGMLSTGRAQMSNQPVPHALPPDVANINETLDKAAFAVKRALRNFYPHDETAAIAIEQLKMKEPQGRIPEPGEITDAMIANAKEIAAQHDAMFKRAFGDPSQGRKSCLSSEEWERCIALAQTFLWNGQTELEGEQYRAVAYTMGTAISNVIEAYLRAHGYRL